MAIFKARIIIPFCYNYFENVVIYIGKCLAKCIHLNFLKFLKEKFGISPWKMKILREQNMSKSLKNKKIYSWRGGVEICVVYFLTASLFQERAKKRGNMLIHPDQITHLSAMICLRQYYGVAARVTDILWHCNFSVLTTRWLWGRLILWRKFMAVACHWLPHMWDLEQNIPPRRGLGIGDRTGELGSLSCSPTLDIVRRVEKNHGW